MATELPRATQVLPAGEWPGRAARDTVAFDFDDRFRRRRYVAAGGLEFLLDLEESVALRDGDGLLLEGGGGVVLVRAAPEPLVEVTAETPERLARLAWHLGNRHLPTQIEGARLLIRDDHVIVAMLRGLGATLRRVDAPFSPERGAYGEHNRRPDHPHAHHQHHHHGHGGDHRHHG
jgi:urease accessory protein